MDDLDRELKLIQIQRERLALERELASQGADKSLKKAIKSIWQVVSALPRALGKFFVRWWKVMFTVVFVIGCFYAAVTWKNYQEQQAKDRRWAKAGEYATTQCGATFSCEGESAFNCLNIESSHRSCQFRAMADFLKRNPLPTD